MEKEHIKYSLTYVKCLVNVNALLKLKFKKKKYTYFLMISYSIFTFFFFFFTNLPPMVSNHVGYKDVYYSKDG